MYIIDTHLAKKKMKIKQIGSTSIFLSTIWNGEVITAIFDKATNELSDVNGFRVLEVDEFKQLENIIIEYLTNGI